MNASDNLHAVFVSENINKVRWRPDPFDNSHSFVTGSWDNTVNHIKLWEFLETDDWDICPYVVSSYDHEGDVTECRFLSPDLLVTSSSTGSVYLIRISVNDRGAVSVTGENFWKNLHKFNNGEESSCTSFAVYDHDIATIGEDGNIHLLTAMRREPIRKIANADSCSLRCIIFLKHNEILTGNVRGQMKIWDLRSPSNAPSSNFLLGNDETAATCLAFHPTQRHMVVAGDQKGSLTVWDLRQNTYPLNLLSAHADAVTELQFHPECPDQLFSSSESGELWHWTVNKKQRVLISEDESESNVWLLGDAVNKKLEVYALMPKLHKPVNGLDLNKDKVLFGCDNEAVYLINNVKVYG